MSGLQHTRPLITRSTTNHGLLILLAFLVVFRGGAARVMAMVPSVFASLATSS